MTIDKYVEMIQNLSFNNYCDYKQLESTFMQTTNFLKYLNLNPTLGLSVDIKETRYSNE